MICIKTLEIKSEHSVWGEPSATSLEVSIYPQCRLQFEERKVHFHRVCSKQCRVVLDLTKGIKFYLKRSMLHVLALGIIKAKLLPFKPFKSMGNQGKRSLHVRILLQIKCTEHLNLRLFQWMALGLAWNGELKSRKKRETLKMVGVFYWQNQLNDV